MGLLSNLNLQFLYTVVSITVVIILLIFFRATNKSSTSSAKNMSFFSFWSAALLCAFGKSKKSFGEIFKSYGPVISIQFYSSPIVILSNDYEMVRDVVNSSDWVDKPKSKIVAERNYGEQSRGLLVSDGDAWKETRKYAIKNLGQLGLGKSSLVDTMNEELQLLLEGTKKLMEETSNKVPVRHLFSLPTINIIWRIAGGHRFALNDPTFTELLNSTDQIVNYPLYQFILYEAFHPIIKIAPGFLKYDLIIKAYKDANKHFTNMVNERKKLLAQDNGGISNYEDNFTDVFLRDMHSETAYEKNKNVFSEKNLIMTLVDFFEAGVDTTSSTLEFAILYLVMHPEVQIKIQTEIKNVVGDREPSFLTDKLSMPYMQAFIYETHRMATIVPFLYRAPIRDCYLKNTFIRKGTSGLINLYSMHYDESFWSDPYNFRPDRFITEDGLIDSSKTQRVFNFGGGKRVCIGEKVANGTIFTFIVGLLQKFSIKIASENEEELGTEIKAALVSHVKPFHVTFTPV